MEETLKCLRCGYEYKVSVDPKRKIVERVCPRCKSNSVRKIADKQSNLFPDPQPPDISG